MHIQQLFTFMTNTPYLIRDLTEESRIRYMSVFSKTDKSGNLMGGLFSKHESFWRLET